MLDRLLKRDVDPYSQPDKSAKERLALFELRQLIDLKLFVNDGISDRIFETVESLCKKQAAAVTSKPTFQHMIQDIVTCRLLTYFLGEVEDINGFEKEYYRYFKALPAERLRTFSVLTSETRTIIKTALKPLRDAFIERTTPALSPEDLGDIITRHNEELGSGGCLRLLESMLSAIGPSLLAEQMADRQRREQLQQSRNPATMDDVADESDAMEDEDDVRQRSRGASASTRTPSSASRRRQSTSGAQFINAYTPSKFTLSPPYNANLAGKTPARPRTPPRRNAAASTTSISTTATTAATTTPSRATTSRPPIRSPPARQYETQAPMSDSSDSEEERSRDRMDVDEEEEQPAATDAQLPQRGSRRAIVAKRAATRANAPITTDEESEVIEQPSPTRRRAKASTTRASAPSAPVAPAARAVASEDEEEEQASQTTRRSTRQAKQTSKAASSRPPVGPREMDSGAEDSDDELRVSFKKTSATAPSTHQASHNASSTNAPSANPNGFHPVPASILDSPPATQEPVAPMRDEYRWANDDGGYDPTDDTGLIPIETFTSGAAMNLTVPDSHDVNNGATTTANNTTNNNSSSAASPTRPAAKVTSPKRTRAKPAAAAVAVVAAPTASRSIAQNVADAAAQLSAFGDIGSIAPRAPKATAAATLAAATTAAEVVRDGVALPPRSQSGKRRGNALADLEDSADELVRDINEPNAKRTAPAPTTQANGTSSSSSSRHILESGVVVGLHSGQAVVARSLPPSWGAEYFSSMRSTHDSHGESGGPPRRLARDSSARGSRAQRTMNAMELVPVCNDPFNAQLPTMDDFVVADVAHEEAEEGEVGGTEDAPVVVEDVERVAEHQNRAPVFVGGSSHATPMVNPVGPDAAVITKTRRNPAFTPEEDEWLKSNFKRFISPHNEMQWKPMLLLGQHEDVLDLDRDEFSIRQRMRTMERNLQLDLPKSGRTRAFVPPR